jgi:hypothetical protein
MKGRWPDQRRAPGFCQFDRQLMGKSMPYRILATCIAA